MNRVSTNLFPTQPIGLACCPPKPPLAGRAPLTSYQATDLATLFGLLAGATRLRLLHLLAIHRELCVSELCRALGMKPQAVSNQLRRLAEAGVVRSRREGLSIYYQIEDPCVTELLDRGLCLLEDSVARVAAKEV